MSGRPHLGDASAPGPASRVVSHSPGWQCRWGANPTGRQPGEQALGGGLGAFSSPHIVAGRRTRGPKPLRCPASRGSE